MTATLLNLDVLMSLAVVASIGVVSNGLSVWYIHRYFNTKKTAFFLLLLDSVISLSACCCVAFVSGTTMAVAAATNVGEDKDSSSAVALVSCLILSTTLLLTPTMGYFLMMEISLLRFYSVRLALRNVTVNEETIFKTAVLTSTIPALYLVSIALPLTLQDIPYSSVLEICLRGDKAVMPHWSVTLAVFLPNMILTPLASLVADAATVGMLRRKSGASSSSSSSSSFDTVPVRATMLTAVFLLAPILAVVLIKISGLSHVASVSASAVLCVLISSVRSPAVTLVSFAYKTSQEALFVSQSREARLRKVVRIAREEREMTQMRKVQRLGEEEALP